MVIDKEGVLRVDQYGQWDGYPSGQGLEILSALTAMVNTHELDTYVENVEKITQITPEQINEVDSTPDWPIKYPHLHRDCGYRIHGMIAQGEVKFVSFLGDAEAAKWCEGFYTIDLRRRLFISDYDNRHSEFSLDSLPTEAEYLDTMEAPDSEDDE